MMYISNIKWWLSICQFLYISYLKTNKIRCQIK